ncbi:hypothetical protein GNI_163080 [Gregarina niphandrodes]|uniref:Uncharacterized protein n=1 Tax=Gregarina niphandrodes TaxID=110365 RepID=A0A023AYD1_GRENI|nr:hypothetical protein GNI_163080 [Gregarina niphandrodes]EZG43664.1 hypothetical protein GNI_163080 [Gregarina niphandrodes]|eukprot:XP_011133103.1 hypothetical protein GNI_163080 [Gregarina niphandrodes]
MIKELSTENAGLKKQQEMCMRTLTTTADSEDAAGGGRSALEAAEKVAVLLENIKLLESALEAKETALKANECVLRDKEHALKDTEAVVKDKEVALQEKEAALQAVIADKESMLREKENEIAQLISEVQRLASRAAAVEAVSVKDIRAEGIRTEQGQAWTEKERKAEKDRRTELGVGGWQESNGRGGESRRVERSRLESKSLRELTHAAMEKVLGWAVTVGIFEDGQRLSRLHLKPPVCVALSTPPGSDSIAHGDENRLSGRPDADRGTYLFEVRLASIYSPPEDPGCIIAHCPLDMLADKVRDRSVQAFLRKRYHLSTPSISYGKSIENDPVGRLDTSTLERPTSTLERPTSTLERPTSTLEGPTSTLEGPTADPWVEELYDLSAEGVRMKLVGRYGTLWRHGGIWQNVFSIRRKLAPLIAAISIHELSSSFRLQGRNMPKDRLLETLLKDAATSLAKGDGDTPAEKASS